MWKDWIGLPHEFRADPRDGKAADCVVMVWAVLEEAKIKCPDFQNDWLDLAEAGRWDAIQTIWEQGTEPLDKPEPYAICLFDNGPIGLGFGIVVDDGVLIVHYKRGVHWVPFRALQKVEYCRFKQ